MKNRMSQTFLIVVTGIFSTIMTHAGWHMEEIIAEKNEFSFSTTQGVVQTSDGTIHVAYGGDHLRVASFNDPDWTYEIVDRESWTGKSPCLFADPDGTRHIIYRGTYDLRYAVCPPGGSWDVTILSDWWYSEISVARDSSGIFHIAARNFYRGLSYITWDGSTFNEQEPGSTIENSYSTCIALTADDLPMIVFISKEAIFIDDWGHVLYDDPHIKTAVQTDDGWQIDTFYVAPPEPSFVMMALDQDDLPHLLISSWTTEAYDLYYYHWTGFTWTADILDYSFEVSVRPSLSWDSSGFLHATYYKNGLNYAVQNGSGWDVEQADASGLSYNSLMLNSDESPVIAAISYSPSAEMALLTRNASIWTSTAFDSSHNSLGFHGKEFLDLAVDASGNPHLAIARDGDLYHMYDEGSGWITEPVHNSSELFYGIGPEIIIDEANVIHIGFSANDSPQSVFYARNDGSGWTVEYAQLTTSFFRGMAITPDGMPWMVCQQYHEERLSFGRKTAQQWEWNEVAVNQVGNYADIAIDSTGQAHISFYDHGTYDLKYAVGYDDSWTIETVDGQTGFEGYYNHIVLNDSDEPFISYLGGDLKVAHKTGSTWNIDSAADMWICDTDIKLDSNGYPHVAGDNKYAYWDGGQWIVDEFEAFSCLRTTLALTPDDQPRIVYSDHDWDIRYVYPDESSPEITDVSPGIFYREGDYSVTVTGQNFLDAVSVEFGSDVKVNSWEVVSETEISADVSVYSFCDMGVRNVSVETADGSDVCGDCLEICYGPPHPEFTEPFEGAQNSTGDFMLHGWNFEDVSSVSFGEGVTVNSFEVISDSLMSVNLTIGSGAELGYRDVQVDNPAGTGVGYDCFLVGMPYTSIRSYGVSVPDTAYTGSPFQVTVKAMDLHSRVLRDWSGTVYISDTVTGTLDPGTIDVVNGVGSVEAIVSAGATNDTIHAITFSPDVEGDSESFDVISSAADCSIEYVDGGVNVMDHFGTRTIAVADDGTVWMVYGYDNLWVAQSNGDEWIVHRVDPAAGTGIAPEITLDHHGHPHIVYTDMVNESLKYAVLTDTGWHIEIVDDNAWQQRTICAIAIGSDSTPHVCYQGLGTYYAYRESGEWIKTKLHDDGFLNVSLDVDGLNRPHIVTFETFSGALIYYGYLNDVWTQSNPNTNGGGNFPSLAVDSNNIPHLSYVKYLGMQSELYHTIWDGAQWVHEILPDSDGYGQTSIAITSEDNPSISAHNGNDQSGQIRFFSFNGAEWNFVDNDATPSGWRLGMALDSTGYPHFSYVFTEGASGATSIEYTHWDGVEWHADTVFEGDVSACSARIVLDSNDNVIVGYAHGSGDEGWWSDWQEVRLASRSGGGWSKESFNTFDDVFIWMNMALDADDDLHVISSIGHFPAVYYSIKNNDVWVTETISEQGDVDYFRTSDIDVAGDDVIWTAFDTIDSGIYTRYFHAGYRTDRGWEIQQLGSHDYSNRHCGPALACGPDHNPRVVFVSDEEGFDKLYMATHSSGSWSVEDVYSTAVWNPHIRIDDQNIPHIVGGLAGEQGIIYLTWTGSQWMEEIVDANAAIDEFHACDIELDDLGNPHILYTFQKETHSSNRDASGLNYAVRVSDEWRWYSVETESLISKTEVDLALDSNDKPHVAYIDTLAGDMKYAECDLFTPPEIMNIIPGGALPGETVVDLAIEGVGLHPVTYLDFGEGILVEEITHVSNMLLFATVSVNPDAATGMRDVRAVAPEGAALCGGCFTVLDPGDPPEIDSVFPNEGNNGDSISVLIQGQQLLETNNVFFSPGVTVNGITVHDENYVTANILINENAPESDYTISLTSTTGMAECTGCFHVNFTAPSTMTPTPTSSTPTQAPTFTPIPTWTPTVNPTQTPTSTPTNTPTRTQTNTPSATPTPPHSFTPTPSPTSPNSHTPTPSPTSTTRQCTTTGVTVTMPSNLFHSGDTCNCMAVVCNAEGQAINGYPLFVILDVYGSYYFAPSFNTTFDNYLNDYSSFPVGETHVEVLPDFPWPDNVGAASGLIFYGALTNPAMTDLFGTLGTWTFGWE